MRTVGIAVEGDGLRAAFAERHGARLTVSLAANAATSEIAAWRPDAVVVGLPVHAVTHRILELPFREPARVAAVLPLELGGQLPAVPEDGVVGHVPLERRGAATTVLAALARRATIDGLVDRCTAAGLPRPTIAIDVLAVLELVPAAHADVAVVLVGARTAVAVRRGGRLAGLRALGAPADDVAATVAELRWSLPALGGVPPLVVVAGTAAGGGPCAAIEAQLSVATRPLGDLVPAVRAGGDITASAVEYALATLDPHSPGMLVLGERPRSAAAGRRWVRRLAAAAAVLALCDLGLYRQALARRDATITRAIAAYAAAALPGEQIVAPRAQLETALAAAAHGRDPLAAAGGALEILRELSERAPAGTRLQLDELDVSAEGVHLHGRVGSFDAVDGLRRMLGASPVLADVTTDDTRTTVDGRAVEFRLHARLRAAEGTAS